MGLRGWLVCGVVLGLVSCGTSPKITWNDLGPTPTEDAQSETDVPGQPDGGGKVDLNVPDAPPEGWGYEIIALGATNGKMEVMAEKPAALSILVLNLRTDQHAANYPVSYVIAESPDDCTEDAECASLTAMEVATDNSGTGSVSFLAGKIAGDYKVKISGQDAAPLILTVTVVPRATGDLRIVFDPSVSSELVAVPNEIKVYVGTGYKQCSQFSPISPWSDYVSAKGATGVSATPLVEDLDPEEVYWVAMLGWRGTAPDKHLVVYGCLDNVKVGPSEVVGETKVTLKVSTVVLNPAGTYDMVNHFDFSDVAMNLPGTAGQVITYIELVFTNPGKALLEGIKLIVQTWVPAWVTDIALGPFEDALANYITQWVVANAPEPVQKFLEIGQDVLQIVNNLQLDGQLKISKLSSGYMNGKESFTGITLYWKWGCAVGDEECGIYHFGLEQLNNSDVPLDLIDGEWNGSMVGFDRLQIDSHPIQLNYGKLILFVLNDVMIPMVTDYDNLEDMLYSIVNCPGLAASMSSSILDGIGLSEQDIEAACDSMLATLLGPVLQSISDLSLPSEVHLKGTATFVDDDNNLVVDRLIDGIWDGDLTMDGQIVGDVKGDFNATRVAFPGQN